MLTKDPTFLNGLHSRRIPDFVYSCRTRNRHAQVHTVGDPKTRVLTRAINFMPLVYLKTMDIRFSSPPLEELQSPTEITITGRNYETYNFNQSSFNDCIRKLEALTRFPLCPGQVEAQTHQTREKVTFPLVPSETNY